MNAACSCQPCANEIASAAFHVVTGHGYVLFAECASYPTVHAWVYPDCPASAHTIDDHPVVVGTSLAAHRELLRIKRVREAAG